MLGRSFLQFSGKRASKASRRAVFLSTSAVLVAATVMTNVAYASPPTATAAAPKQPGSPLGGARSKRKISIHAVRGPRATMEDRWFVSDDLRFFAVYDGHGGYRVAEQAQRFLYDEFLKQLDDSFDEQELAKEVARAQAEQTASSNDTSSASDVESKPSAASPPAIPKNEALDKEQRFAFFDDPKQVGRALTKSFDIVSKKVLSSTYLDLEGSTAVVVCLCEDNIVSANLGDSRAILCRGSKALPLTVDHKPDSASERKRIEELGGKVRWHGYLGPDKLPVPGMGAYRINGNLAVSRALGDRLERPYVSSEPDIAVLPMNRNEDRFIVLASDGLWDVMTSQDVVDFVKQIMSMGTTGSAASANTPSSRNRVTSVVPAFLSSPSKTDAIRNEIDKRQESMAQFLVEEALRRGSADNVTAIVVWLR